MSHRKNKEVGGRQSTGSCNTNNYEPFMLGASYGPGVNSVGAPQSRGRRDSVRDCMEWPGMNRSMGNAARLAGGGNGSWNPGMMMPGSPAMSFSQQPNKGGNYQPQAFVSAAGSGQGEGVSIPFQIAPLGTNPASMIKPLEPITLRVNAPSPSVNQDGSRGPIRFTISPDQIYGRMQ